MTYTWLQGRVNTLHIINTYYSPGLPGGQQGSHDSVFRTKLRLKPIVSVSAFLDLFHGSIDSATAVSSLSVST